MTEPLSARLREQAYEHAHGRCACRWPGCDHAPDICGEALRAGWQVRLHHAAGAPEPVRAEAVCRECHARHAAATGR